MQYRMFLNKVILRFFSEYFITLLWTSTVGFQGLFKNVDGSSVVAICLWLKPEFFKSITSLIKVLYDIIFMT